MRHALLVTLSLFELAVPAGLAAWQAPGPACPPHYVFGQFTRFIRPGARRIACTSNNDDVVATAFIDTDGTIAVVLTNTSDREQPAQVWVAGKTLKFSCPAGGVMTLTM